MTVAGFLRSQVRQHLVELIEARASGAVAVARGFPGPFLMADQIWITGTTGEVSLDVFAGRARPTDDRFTISFLCMASVQGRSIDEAEGVAESFAELVLDAVHDESLDSFESGNTYVISTRLGRCDDYCEGRDTGYAAFYTIDLDVHTRTRYSGADAQ